MGGKEVVASVLLALLFFLTCALWASIAVLKRRRSIQMRSFILMLATGGFLLLHSSFSCLVNVLEQHAIPCWMTSFVDCFVLPAAFATVVLRGIRVDNMFKLANLQGAFGAMPSAPSSRPSTPSLVKPIVGNERRKSSEGRPLERSSFKSERKRRSSFASLHATAFSQAAEEERRRHLRRSQGSYLLCCFCVIMLPPMVIGLVLYLMNQEDGCSASAKWQSILIEVYILLLFAILLRSDCFTKAQLDVFGIIDELKIIAFVSVAFAIVNILLSASSVSLAHYTDGIASNSYVSILRQLGIIWYSYWKPCRAAYRPKNTKKRIQESNRKSKASSYFSASEEVSSFGILLASPVGRELFQKHLVREFSVENLLFWKSICDYIFNIEKEGNDVSRNTERANFIYKKFIQPGTAECVNLPGSIVEAVKQAIETKTVCTTSFDTAHENIYNLMRRDSYPRFRKGPLYQEYQDEVAKDPVVNEPYVDIIRRIEAATGGVGF